MREKNYDQLLLLCVGARVMIFMSGEKKRKNAEKNSRQKTRRAMM
jgi:hypothetical protein